MPIHLNATSAELILAFVRITLGFSIQALRASILQIHPELEEAAIVAGMSLSQRIRFIVGPLIKSALGNVWVWVFMQVITNLALALILYEGSNSLISTEIYRRWNQGLTTTAAALGTLLMVASLVLATLVRRFTTRRSDDTNTHPRPACRA